MNSPLKNFQEIIKSFRQKIFGFQAKIDDLKYHQKMKLEMEPKTYEKPPALPSKRVTVEISASSVARSGLVVLLLLLLFYFLYQISSILVIFFVSFLFAAALDPIVGKLQLKKIPRSIGVLIIYLIIFIILGLSLANLVPIIAKQIFDIGQSIGSFVQSLSSNEVSKIPFYRQLEPYIQQLLQAIDVASAAGQFQLALQALGSQLLNISVGLMNVLLTLILTFFMTVEEKSLEKFYLSLFPSKYGHYITSRMEVIKQKIGYWLRGQLLLCLVATIISYIGLLILKVDYALTLSIIAGIMMVVPVMGRVFALIVTIPIVLNQSPVLALWVSIFYLVLQQIEVNILSPYIMNKAVGLNPIITIFAMLVGYQYLGILGLIISIPIATTAAIFVQDYLEKEK